MYLVILGNNLYKLGQEVKHGFDIDWVRVGWQAYFR